MSDFTATLIESTGEETQLEFEQEHPITLGHTLTFEGSDYAVIKITHGAGPTELIAFEHIEPIAA